MGYPKAMADTPFNMLGGVLYLAAVLADSPMPLEQAVQAFPPDVVIALALDPATLPFLLPSKEALGLAGL